MRNYIEFPLRGGDGTLVAEITVDDLTGEVPVAGIMLRASETLEDALGRMRPAATALVDAIRDLAPDETEIEFGVKLTGKAGAVLASAAAEAHYKVKLTWRKPIE